MRFWPNCWKGRVRWDVEEEASTFMDRLLLRFTCVHLSIVLLCMLIVVKIVTLTG